MGYHDDMETTVLKVEGMSCSHCVRSVSEALKAVTGVSIASVNLELERAEVVHDDTVTAATLVAAIAEEGYQATLVQ
jgi:copper chaperone CopZ